MTRYLKNIETGGIGVFANPQEGWIDATPEEIAAFLLEQAKEKKLVELRSCLDDFQNAGYMYTGSILCEPWVLTTTYQRKDLVFGADMINYISLKSDNVDNEPPAAEWWSPYQPVFKTNDKTTENVILKDKLPPAAPERYIFSAKDNIPINFEDGPQWTAFVEVILQEKDRVMRKYVNYGEQIDLCETVAEIEAITFDFSV